MVYKQITEEQYQNYFPWDGEHEETGPKTITSSSSRMFGKPVVWRTRVPDFINIACYALLPNNHKGKRFNSSDLHYFISKEYLMHLLLSPSASADSGD